MLALHTVRCPYCNETFQANVDASGGDQEYVEDCYICCQPIVFRITVDAEGNLTSLDTRCEND